MKNLNEQSQSHAWSWVFNVYKPANAYSNCLCVNPGTQEERERGISKKNPESEDEGLQVFR